MHLNEVAEGLEPLDLSQSAEFQSLLQSAADLGIPHSPNVKRYVSRNTVVRHQRLHFLEWGDPAAPPVLLLHGVNQTSHAWDLVSLHLADRYHVYALDHRGHGDSEWARDQEYNTDAMANDAVAFMQQQGIVRPIIIAHSMGGRVTMRIATRYPELARAICFVDVAPIRSGDGGGTIREFMRRNVEFDRIEDFIERVRAYDPFRPVEHMERTARYNLFRRADGKYVSKSDRFLHERDRREMQQADQITLDEVGAIPCPVLVMRGESSNIVKPEAAEEFAKAVQDGRWVQIEQCGHNVHTQNTPGFLAALAPFLEYVGDRA